MHNYFAIKKCIIKKCIAVLLLVCLTFTGTQSLAFANETPVSGTGSEQASGGEGPDASVDPTAPINPLDSDGSAGESGSGDVSDPTDASDPSGVTDPVQPTDDPTATSATESTTDPTKTTAKATTTTTKKKPATVPKVKVKKKGPALQISWNKITGANYYEVYRSYKAGKKGKRIAKVKGKLSFKDKKVKSGKKAYYKVRAHKKSGFQKYSKPAAGIIYRVYVEAGHGIDSRGRWDPGCTWKGYQEAKLMIPICQSMTRHLREKGVYVYTDSFSGNNKNLLWLVKNIKKYNVSVLVNVHCDYKKAPRGTLPLYKTKKQKKLAKCLNKGVHKKVKIKDRGLQKRKDLLTLKKTTKYCTACLFETGNIKKDNKILRKKYDAYGEGLAMGVCSYLGVKW